MIGVSAIISVTIIAATLPNLSALEIEPAIVGFMLVSVWTISVNIAPYAASVRVAARMIQADPPEIGIVWNGRYSLAVLCMLTIALVLFG